MSMTLRSILSIFAIACAANGMTANAAIIENGSFELPGGAPIRASLSEVNVPGWSYNDLGFAIYESSGRDDISAQHGNYYISFGHNGSTGEVLSQSFGTIAGESLAISFFVSEQQKGGSLPNTEALRVSLVNGASSYTQDIVVNGTVWTKVDLPVFVSTGGASTLTFTSIKSASATNWALDNVVVSSTAPIPEPSAALMFVLGLTALSLHRLRNRKSELALARLLCRQVQTQAQLLHASSAAIASGLRPCKSYADLPQCCS